MYIVFFYINSIKKHVNFHQNCDYVNLIFYLFEIFLLVILAIFFISFDSNDLLLNSYFWIFCSFFSYFLRSSEVIWNLQFLYLCFFITGNFIQMISQNIDRNIFKWIWSELVFDLKLKSKKVVFSLFHYSLLFEFCIFLFSSLYTKN